MVTSHPIAHGMGYQLRCQNFQKRNGKNTHMAKKTAPNMSKSLVFMAYGFQIENAPLYSRHAVTGKAKACQVPAH